VCLWRMEDIWAIAHLLASKDGGAGDAAKDSRAKEKGERSGWRGAGPSTQLDA
jgi:hypothetical protein